MVRPDTREKLHATDSIREVFFAGDRVATIATRYPSRVFVGGEAADGILAVAIMSLAATDEAHGKDTDLSIGDVLQLVG